MKGKTPWAFVFCQTIPVMTGYLFLGMGFGMLMVSKGIHPLWAVAMSLFVYAGAMQYVAVDLLSGGFRLLTTAVVTLMVNARHIFYGIAMLERVRDMGRIKPLFIHYLTDETFSVLQGAKAPDGMDPNQHAFLIALLHHIYWVIGSAAGAVAGSLFDFPTKGIDFVLTAVFTVALTEQWLAAKNKLPAVIGILVSVLCLVVFGSEWFLLPTMGLILLLLTVLRRYTETEEDAS